MERIVPISEKLKSYITKKNIESLKRYNVKRIDKYNREVKRIRGCEKCSFHSWRSYAISQMLKNGIDEYIRGKIVGHKIDSKDVYGGYTHIELSTMKKAVDLIY